LSIALSFVNSRWRADAEIEAARLDSTQGIIWRRRVPGDPSFRWLEAARNRILWGRHEPPEER
jgi:hypothetical protein